MHEVKHMKVLLLGDSIRMFYEKEVSSQLGVDYEVFAPEENCRFSSYMLNSLRFWLDEFPTPDIIHFNVGLWDCAILYSEDGCFTDIDDYAKNVKKILRELKKTGARIIFATSTPVSDEKEFLVGPIPPKHRNEDIIRYNNVICENLKNEDIIVDDLFSLMYSNKEKYLSNDMIHPNEEGVVLLGTAVANCIRKFGVYENKKCVTKNMKKANKKEKTIQ